MAENPSGLQKLGSEASLGQYLSEIWERREFAVVVPANDLRAQNMDTALGQLWHILNPAALIAIYWLIFGVLLGVDRGVDNFLVYLTVGVMTYQLTTRVVQDASASIPRNEGLIRSIRFPRALLPISSVVGQTLAFGPALLVTFITIILSGGSPSLRWLLFPAVLGAQTLFNAGAALGAARAGARVRDLPQILPHVFRLLFYASGILFSAERLLSGRSVFGLTDTTLMKVMAANPIYAYVQSARWSLMGLPVGTEVWVSILIWTVVTPVAGLRYFRRHEHRYGA